MKRPLWMPGTIFPQRLQHRHRKLYHIGQQKKRSAWLPIDTIYEREPCESQKMQIIELLSNMFLLEDATLSHYHLGRRLARGGMSEVYLAYDEHAQREVAIKVVHNSQAEDLERLRREMDTLSRLKHPHILPTLDQGVHESWHYFAMPYIGHGTMRERLVQGPLTLQEAGMLLEQIASALQFAHDHGIIHRDIKPSNILLDENDHVYLADFGLAKPMEKCSDITQTDCLIGTPEYMAPELVN